MVYTEREKQYKRDYYQKNREKILERTRLYSREWYKNNKIRIDRKHKEYDSLHREEIAQYHREWYKRKKKKVLEASKKYYQENKTRVQIRHRKYNKDNKEKLQQYKGEWQKKKRKIDPRYRLNANMGRAIWYSLKNKKNGQKWESLVKYSLDDLISHLSKKFDERMSWNNYGEYWAVDHIKPQSLFFFSSHSDEEFKNCWDINNLQPLEKIENIKKRNKYIN